MNSLVMLQHAIGDIVNGLRRGAPIEGDLVAIAATFEPYACRLSGDGAAVVNQTVPWLPASAYPPPLNVKLQVIHQGRGVSTQTVLRSPEEAAEWTHWQGLPVFADDEKTLTLGEGLPYQGGK